MKCGKTRIEICELVVIKKSKIKKESTKGGLELRQNNSDKFRKIGCFNMARVKKCIHF